MKLDQIPPPAHRSVAASRQQQLSVSKIGWLSSRNHGCGYVQIVVFRAKFLMHVCALALMDGAYFVGRSELISWLNDFLKMNFTKVEETASGAPAL